jgi:hypothetical protein
VSTLTKLVFHDKKGRRGVRERAAPRIKWLVWPENPVKRKPQVIYKRVQKSLPKNRVFVANVAGVFQPIHELVGPWLKKVLALNDLRDGWNGYKAPAPAIHAIIHARAFLLIMLSRRIEPTRVAASAVGGVAITRRKGPRKVMVEFFNDGSAHALFADDSTEELHTLAVRVSKEGYDQTLKRMTEYLDG